MITCCISSLHISIDLLEIWYTSILIYPSLNDKKAFDFKEREVGVSDSVVCPLHRYIHGVIRTYFSGQDCIFLGIIGRRVSFQEKSICPLHEKSRCFSNESWPQIPCKEYLLELDFRSSMYYLIICNGRLFWDIPYLGRLSAFLLPWLRSKVERLTLATKMKILSWKFVGDLKGRL